MNTNVYQLAQGLSAIQIIAIDFSTSLIYKSTSVNREDICLAVITISNWIIGTFYWLKSIDVNCVTKKQTKLQSNVITYAYHKSKIFAFKW